METKSKFKSLTLQAIAACATIVYALPPAINEIAQQHPEVAWLGGPTMQKVLIGCALTTAIIGRIKADTKLK